MPDDADVLFTAQLGERLRELRQAQGMSQGRLAELAAVTKSFVSQLERGKAMPSVTTIRRLTNALGLTLANLFAELPESQPHHPIVVRAEHRRTIATPGRNVQLLLLAPNVNRAMEPIYNILLPGQATADEPMAHEGEEWLYVVKGTALLIVGEEQMTLHPGDAAYFESRVPHRLVNVDDKPVEVIWVVTPPLY